MVILKNVSIVINSESMCMYVFIFFLNIVLQDYTGFSHEKNPFSFKIS